MDSGIWPVVKKGTLRNSRQNSKLWWITLNLNFALKIKTLQIDTIAQRNWDRSCQKKTCNFSRQQSMVDHTLTSKLVAEKIKISQFDTISKWNWDRSCQKERLVKNSRQKCTRTRQAPSNSLLLRMRLLSLVQFPIESGIWPVKKKRLWAIWGNAVKYDGCDRRQEAVLVLAIERTGQRPIPSAGCLSPLITGKFAPVQPQCRQCQQVLLWRWVPGLKSLLPIDFTFVGKLPRALDPL
jgi:hypothetical protein